MGTRTDGKREQGAQIGNAHVPGQDELVTPEPGAGSFTTEKLALPGVQDARDHQLVLGAQRRG